MQLQYFVLKEFDCKETGNNEMCPLFLEKLEALRAACGFAFIITSGYRDPSHSIEAKKTVPGTHAKGIAADIYIGSGAEGYSIVKEAMKLGFAGIGVAKTFIHVDTRTTKPVMWCY
jgi:zinc D-Ala-D-Ala carboxypeptidase